MITFNSLEEAKEGLIIAQNIHNEISESIESGEMNREIDAELKAEETFWDKILNVFE